MAELIKPLLTGKPFESTVHRLGTLFQPIQATRNKKSDFVAYLATPVLDWLVLDSAFALDTSIRLINATASLLKASYLWTLNQQRTDKLIDKATDKEFDEFLTNVVYILSSLLAQIANLVLSAVSLITRPIASIAEEMNDSAQEAQFNF